MGNKCKVLPILCMHGVLPCFNGDRPRKRPVPSIKVFVARAVRQSLCAHPLLDLLRSVRGNRKTAGGSVARELDDRPYKHLPIKFVAEPCMAFISQLDLPGNLTMGLLVFGDVRRQP